METPICSRMLCAACCVPAPEHRHSTSAAATKADIDCQQSGQRKIQRYGQGFPQKTGIFTPCPRFLPSRHARRGIFLSAVGQGVTAPSADIVCCVGAAAADQLLAADGRCCVFTSSRSRAAAPTPYTAHQKYNIDFVTPADACWVAAEYCVLDI